MENYPELRMVITLLRIMGHDINNDMKSNFYTVLHSFAAFGVFGPSFIELMSDSLEFKAMKDHLFSFTNILMYVVKVIAFRKNISVLREIIDLLKDLWLKDHFGPDLQKKQNRIYKITYYTIVFNVFLVCTILLLFYSASITGEKVLPFNLKSFSVMTRSPYFELMLTFVTLNSIFVGGFILAIKLLFINLIVIGYCQMMMLKHGLSTVNLKDISDKNEEKKAFDSLKHYAEYFAKLLGFYNNFGQLFSSIIFFEFYVNIINLCLPLFALAKVDFSDMDADKEVILHSLLGIISTISDLFVICVLCTINSEQTKSLSNLVYKSYWETHRLSHRLKTCILMIMQRSQVGYEFTAGNYIKVDMEAFIFFIQLSFSYYTLFKYIDVKN